MNILARIAQGRRQVYYGWWVFASGLTIVFVGSVHSYAFATFFLPLTRDLGLSRATTSVVFSATRLESGIEGPFIGWLIDRIGPRPIIFVGALLAGGGFILLGTVVHNFWGLFLVYVFVLSLGFTGGLWQAVPAAFNVWFIRRRSTAIGSLGTAFRFGGFLWAPTVAFLVLNLGWQTAAVMAGILVLAIVTPASLLFRRSPESMGLLPDGDRPKAPKDGASVARAPLRHSPQAGSVDFTVRQALKSPTFWVFTLALALRNLATGAVAVHIIPMLVWRGASEQGAANLYGLSALAAAPMALVWGMLADRWPAHRVYALSVAFGALGLVILNWSQSHWYLYIFVLCWGFSEAGVPVSFAMVGNFFGRKTFATLRGIQGSLFALGGFVTPVFTGLVWDKTGSYQWALIPSVIAMALALPLFLLLSHPRPPAEQMRAASVSGSTPV